MNKFEIININTGAINTNFEDIKREVEDNLKMYVGVEVSEESLPMCKDLKKNLSRQIKDIDAFRKMVKKEASAPISDFEGKCKELQSIISDVMEPIESGIKELDKKKREEKLASAMEIVKDVAKKMNFDDVDAITIDESWGNVSTTQKAIKEDVTEQIQSIRDAQRAHTSRVEKIKIAIDKENSKLLTKISFDEFADDVESELSDDEIIAKVKKLSDLLFKAENNIVKELDLNRDNFREIDDFQSSQASDDGYSVFIYDDDSTSDDVIELLVSNGYFAKKIT